MRDKLLLLTAITFVTWIGTRMTAIALPLVALAETGQVWSTGIVGGVAGLPLLTVGWWGQGVRDRLSSGRALAVVMAVNAVGLAVVPMSALIGQLGAVTLCVSGLVTGIAGALLGPAERALVADLADEHVSRIGRVGAAQWLAWQDLAHRTSMIFAPPAGAWLVTVWGAPSLLWCEALIVALAAAAMLAVPPAQRGTAPTGENVRPAETAASTLAVLHDHPQIAMGVLMAGVGGLSWFGFSLGLAVLGAAHDLPGVLIAVGMGSYGAASVATSLLVPHVIERLPRMATMVVCWATLGIVFIALPAVIPDLVGVGSLSAVGGVATPWGIAALNALISEQTAGSTRRAAFTAETMLHSGGTSVGLLVGGGLIGLAGAEPMLIATGALQVAAAVAGACAMTARSRDGRWRGLLS